MTSTGVDVATRSECGPVRSDNQDNLFVDAARRIFCVCDGMGGGQGGAEASRLACGAVARAIIADDTFTDRVSRIGRALRVANGSIREFAARAGYWAMGTTAVVLAVEESDSATPKAAICWAGDSRAYRFRGGRLECLTRDHTVANELARLTEEGASAGGNRKRAYSHMLTRALGTDELVKPEWLHFDAAPGDAFLLCSDGIHDMLLDAAIAAAFAAGGTAENIARRIEEAVLVAGAKDNYSLVVARFP